jgi:DivIVA domain-containing protein
MDVLVLEIVVAAAVVFVVAAVAMGYGGSITHFAPDWPGRRLPEDRTLRPDDVTHLRFSLAFRGYRMSEVDEALDRLSTEIAQRDARIEQLTGRPYETPPEAEPEVGLEDGPAVGPEPPEPEPEPSLEATAEQPDPVDPNAAL